jgi:predicted amino acid racemase
MRDRFESFLAQGIDIQLLAKGMPFSTRDVPFAQNLLALGIRQVMNSQPAGILNMDKQLSRPSNQLLISIVPSLVRLR